MVFIALLAVSRHAVHADSGPKSGDISAIFYEKFSQQYTLQIQAKNGKSTKHWVLFGVLGGSSSANVGRTIKHGLHVQRRLDKPRTCYSNLFEPNVFIL